ncbi:hypothetical protein [Blastopirellula retiformator]|uniref:Uncharacterized protein n=1 Tax=Blastopirellula retiformator TaxID=2527970 RepID=A0A5C5V2K9_9BACT|nr:hypothetical protein [Blastopirellula retiformator]TWT32836.1 hypothetical protein Enr8_26420 [Blastopirellula retiformator]
MNFRRVAVLLIAAIAVVASSVSLQAGQRGFFRRHARPYYSTPTPRYATPGYEYQTHRYEARTTVGYTMLFGI